MLWEPQSGCAHRIQKHASKDANNATVNIGVQVSFDWFSLDICPIVGLLGHMVDLFLVS